MAGLGPAAILTVFDTFVNNRMRIGYRRQEYPIVRATAAHASSTGTKKEAIRICSPVQAGIWAGLWNTVAADIAATAGDLDFPMARVPRSCTTRTLLYQQ